MSNLKRNAPRPDVKQTPELSYFKEIHYSVGFSRKRRKNEEVQFLKPLTLPQLALTLVPTQQYHLVKNRKTEQETVKD